MEVQQVPQLSHFSRPKKASFLQRSASVASLLAWKDNFEIYSGKFKQKSNFVSYTSERSIPDKLANEIGTIYNTGPVNDLPPEYPAIIVGDDLPPPPFDDESVQTTHAKFGQDFTALESYLKRKLSFKKKGSHFRDSQLEAAKVFKWMFELPEGDNLEEFLDAYGIPTKGVDMTDLKGKLKLFIQEGLVGVTDINTVGQEKKPKESDKSTPAWKRQMDNLEELAYGDNLEKWLESIDVPYFRPIPETKQQIRKYLSIPENAGAKKASVASIPSADPMTTSPSTDTKDFPELLPKWKELLEKMGSVKNEDDLDKWLASLDVPHNINKAEVHAQIKKYFRHETYDNFKGKALVMQDNHLAKKLWEKFEDASILKKVGLIGGTTAVLGIVAVLSAAMFSLAIPAALATNSFFSEVFVQYFLQRHEVAFNLLNFHAANAKPMSTAWAKQYVLWKYC